MVIIGMSDDDRIQLKHPLCAERFTQLCISVARIDEYRRAMGANENRIPLTHIERHDGVSPWSESDCKESNDGDQGDSSQPCS